MTFKVRLTRDAEADLNWLFDVLLECRQSRDDDDLNLPTQAVAALQSGMATLRTAPFTSRKTGQSLFPREQAMSFGRSGYVALSDLWMVRGTLAVAG